MSGPLEGLRVLELATGVAGPYGGRLLAMLGAEVVKIEPEGGDPVRRQPLDSRPVNDPSPLHIHLNAGKRLVSASAVPLVAALDWADVVIAGHSLRELEASDLAIRGDDGPIVITTSPWGFEADDPGSVTDELLVQAASGAMSTTGDRDGPPLRFPGFQAQYVAGAYVAVAALAARRGPGWRHIDVPWVHGLAAAVEAGFANHLQTGVRELPGGAHQLGIYPSGALPCKDGFVVPGTIRPQDWVRQCSVYGREDLLRDERFSSRRRRARNHRELWTEIEPWYRTRSRRHIFDAALEVGWALGMILCGSDLLRDNHVEQRGFLGAIEVPNRGALRIPVRPFIAPGVDGGRRRLAVAGEDDLWFASAVHSKSESSASPADSAPLAGLRILELTTAWAGPFVGRFLGALGADVVKIEGAGRPDGWRGPVLFSRAAAQLGRGEDEMSVDIAPNFNSINRNKRHCVLDLTRADGREVFLELVSRADAVVANFTARVLPKLGLGYEDLRAANPRIVLVHMPALGSSGPHKDLAGYGSVVEGMGGFGALFGTPAEGARISQTYFPDPVAGLHATLSLLALLERRDREGVGGEIDLSHQETLWLQFGETLVLAASEGRDAERMGNCMPGAVTSGVFPTRDGRFVAVSSDVSCDDLLEDSAQRDCQELLRVLNARGAACREVLHIADACHSDLMKPAIERLHHEVTGETAYLRVPLRVDGRALESRSPAPTFDRHTREVLRDWLGKRDAELDALTAGGAVGGRPDPRALQDFYRKRSRGARAGDGT